METTTPQAENPPASTARVFGFLLSLDAEYFPAVTLGQDWPTTRNGKKTSYYWKESLRSGKLQDARGLSWEFQPKDIDAIVQDVNRAMQLAGHEPSLDERHPTRENPTRGKNYGWVRGARKNEKGRLELLHQFVGKDEENEALNKKTSILLLQDRQDQLGNKYRWWIDQNAIVSNPQLRDLDPEFKPALAASNGDSVDAIQLFLADEAHTPTAPQAQGPIMDITILRAALGDKAKDQPDEKVIALSAEALTTTTTALSETANKLKDQTEANGLLVKELNTAEGKVKELSLSAEAEAEPEMDPRVKAMLGDAADQARELALSAGIPPAAAKLFDEIFDDAQGEPNALALSSCGSKNRTLEYEFWKKMKQFVDSSETWIKPNNAVKRGTPVKPNPALALSDKDEEPAAPITPERKTELLALAGYTA